MTSHPDVIFYNNLQGRAHKRPCFSQFIGLVPAVDFARIVDARRRFCPVDHVLSHHLLSISISRRATRFLC